MVSRNQLILLLTIENMSPIEAKRQSCEVYSRVVGYYRPVKQWNDGKAAEFIDRSTFKIEETSSTN